MAIFRIGNLGFKTELIYDQRDWTNIKRADWRRYQMQFHPLSVWDCGRQAFSNGLPDKIEIAPVFETSAVDPFGNHNAKERNSNLLHLIGKSGLGSPEAFARASRATFPSVSIPVPKKDLQRLLDKRYRVVIGYRRRDRFIRCAPAGSNPLKHFMVLCVPDRIDWILMTIGVCGTERLVEMTTESLGGEGDFVVYSFLVFDRPGPYGKLTPPRETRVALKEYYPKPLFAPDHWEVKQGQLVPLLRRILRDDAEEKRKRAKMAGAMLFPKNPFTLRDKIDPTLIRNRKFQDHQEMSRRFGS